MPTPSDADGATTLAAVDLGSNSFHLIVVRAGRGTFQVQDRLREMVQLGAGLDADRRLSAEAQGRALACLERFGQRLRTLPRGRVRAVGTNTLRRARDAGPFLRRAAAALGHPVEIISGIEEARLIYLGVVQGLPGAGRRLVLDIGGGSTELIIGRGSEPERLESLYMGCLGISRAHFADGRVGAKSWRQARLDAALELEGPAQAFRARGWEEAAGASGTVRSIGRVLQGRGWGDGASITAEGLARLEQALLAAGRVDRLGHKGMRAERAAVFPGGLAVLCSLFEALGLERLRIAETALREGLIYDQIGRGGETDARARSVEAMARCYGVDPVQARRVQTTADALWCAAAASWGLADGDWRRLLGWAAALHEIGLAVAHAQFHRHGAYIVANADLLGFSRHDQALLAVLVRGHRRKLPLTEIAALPEEVQRPVLRSCILLRLAVLLHRARTAPPPPVELEARPGGLATAFPSGWLATHPLTAAELEREARFLAAADIALAYR